VIATVGPATRDKEILEKMIHEGVDVFRMNLSHDTHNEHLKTIRFLNQLNEELGSSVAIMGDLQGPKLRIGDMENGGVQLEDGQKFSFVSTPCTGDREKAFLSYEKLAADVTVGEWIMVPSPVKRE
jgi:pyruvate kinase